jgi:hypothetical protein
VRVSILAAGLLVGYGLFLTGSFPPGLTVVLVVVPNAFLWRHRPRPAFLVDGHTFAAVPVRLQVYTAAGAMACAFGMLGTVRGDRDLRIMAVPTVVLLVVLAGFAVLVVVRSPRVVLTPSEVILRRLWRTRTFPWSALATPVQIRRWDNTLTLVVNGATERTFFGRLETDHRFLADAVEHYRTHPEDRASIGTFEGHARLDAALRAWHAAYWRARGV